MKLIAGCLSFIGIIAILAVLVLGVGYVMLSLEPPLKTQMQPVSMSSEAVTSLNKKLSAFEAEVTDAAKANESRPVTLTITEEEANSKLVEVLAEDATMPIKDMLFNFRENSVMGYGRFDTPIFNAKVAVLATVDITKGKPRIVAQDIDLGRLPISGSIANTGASWVLRVMSELITVPGDLPWEATSVVIENGKLSVRGLTQSPN